MDTNRDMSLIKKTGEHLVCAELCRRGFNVSNVNGIEPKFDILLSISNNLKTTLIIVKVINNGEWQLDARNFLDITVTKDNKQILNGLLKSYNEELPFVFVYLALYGNDEFYIIKSKDLQKIIFKKYDNKTLVDISGQDLVKYKDKWKSIA